jgi:hypothetical protein
MEFLSNLFFIVASRESEGPPAQQKPLFIIRPVHHMQRVGAANEKPFHAALWPMLSDHGRWIEWEDVLGMLHGGVDPPSSLCFRRLGVLQDYNMTTVGNPKAAAYWRKYRESLWAHLRVPVQRGSPVDIRRVLFLRRPSSRRMLNHDAIATMLQAHGFTVRSMLPDKHSLLMVASAAVQTSLLIGINSGAYNAVFLRTGCGVLGLAPLAQHTEMSFEGTMPWQAGFESLGVHQHIYSCPLLSTRSLSERLISDSTNAPHNSTLGMHSPIVVSPRTILKLLIELAELLAQVRESGSEAGNITVHRCFSWERSHTHDWAPYKEHEDKTGIQFAPAGEDMDVASVLGGFWIGLYGWLT